MNESALVKFQLEIDGKLHDIYADLESAKRKGIFLANGTSSIKITSGGNGVFAPSSAWCWDYESGDWLRYPNAGLAEAKPKQG